MSSSDLTVDPKPIAENCEEVTMPGPNTEAQQNDGGAPAPSSAKPSTLSVIVNPEDTVGIPLEPAYISLGLKPEHFKKESGGTSD